MYRSDDTNVYPQQLTPGGSKIEKALAEYKKEVNPPHFTNGYVDDCPSLKIFAKELGQEDITLQHPYPGVEELYGIAEQSQVGTAKETLFRLDARKSKEFSSVEVLNESWKDKVTAVCDQIRQVLAPGAKKVNAELYKLLIYSKGDFFHRHQDAQHSARMFATLLCFLPVQYVGGEFEIFKPGNYRDAKVIEDKKMPNGCSWVAFYTDVRHQVNKLNEGFRVVLNYCLSFDGAMSPSPFLPPMQSQSAITDYFKTCTKLLAIPLSYEYTLATLSPDFLKGIDAYIFNAVGLFASPELHFVMRFNKTKVIPSGDPWDCESDHEQVFQGVFLVNYEIAQEYFKIQKKSEQQMEDKKWEETRSLRTERDDKYLALLKKVKASQEGFDLEWIVERKFGNSTVWSKSHLNFDYGQMGWLGNMTPAEEYYYIQAAIVV